MKKLLQKTMVFWQRKGILRSPKSRYRQGLASGFTLIELLVAALIASLLVTVLLSFLIGVLDSDRKETAKSNSQEELQAAISFISDDMQEAIYIYGAEALAAINDQLPHRQANNVCDATTTPATNPCTPILVFWKRFTYNPDSTGTYGNLAAIPTTQIIGCMPYGVTADVTACVANKNAGNRAYGRDTYTYSLVAYYLKNDDPSITGNVTTGWSQTARILRWELKDGYVAYCSTGGILNSTTTSTGCPAITNVSLRKPTNSSPKITTPITLVDTNSYFINPAQGFNRPDFIASGGLSLWKKFDDYDFATNPFVTLVDFMDDTAYLPSQGGDTVAAGTGIPASATAAFKIPIGQNDASTPARRNLDCDDPSVGVGTTDSVNNFTQRIPADFADFATSNPSRLSSFYACVSPNTVTARIFLRGNAIARLGSPAIAKTQRTPTNNNITFFPTADVRSFGRSSINIGKVK